MGAKLCLTIHLHYYFTFPSLKNGRGDTYKHTLIFTVTITRNDGKVFYNECMIPVIYSRTIIQFPCYNNTIVLKVGGRQIIIFKLHWGGCEGEFVKFNSFLKNEQMTELWFKINLYFLFLYECIIMLLFY